ERIGESAVSAVGSAAASGSESPPVDARHTRDSEPLPAASVMTQASDGVPGLRVWRASTGGSPGRTSEADAALRETEPAPDHAAAFERMLAELRAQGVDLDEPLAAVGHRVVHGGERFVEPTLVTEEVEAAIDELSTLAPLHNPPNLAGIR